MHIFTRSIMTAAILSASIGAEAYTITDGKMQWEFLNSTFSSNHDRYGIPDDSLLTNRSDVFDQDFIRRLAASLPERKNNAATNDTQTHITFTEDTEVSITFLHEGAGYRNSIGFFTYDEASIPTSRADISEKIVFPNTSYPAKRSTGLSSGDTLTLGSFTAGTSIGLVLIADGFHSSSGVRTNRSEDWIFYNIDDLNDLNTSLQSSSKEDDARYIVERKASNRIKFEGANPGLGEDQVEQTDVFVIRASATGLPCVVKTKASRADARTSIENIGDSATDDLGFNIELISRTSISASEAEYTFHVSSVSNRHALSHIEFTFDESATISSHTSNYANVARISGDSNQANSYLTKQNVSWKDDSTDSVIIAWEDINRNFSYSDHDFNDVILSLKTTVPNAIEVGDFPELNEPVDTDSDGITDELDEFPEDPSRASTTYTPGIDREGTLAYEDRWPWGADGDINDTVVNYRIAEIKDSNAQVKEINARIVQRSRGGVLATGFAFHFQDIAAESVEYAAVSIDGGEYSEVLVNEATASNESPVLEPGQTDAVVWVYGNSHQGTSPEGQAASCEFWNTEPGCPNYASIVHNVKIIFTQPQTLPAAPYNPFIFRSYDRSIEVHLPDYVPTDLADLERFGTETDASVPADGRYYRTINNMPWALHIPNEWRYPCERCDVIQAYPEIVDWITSGGTDNQDWYEGEVNSEYLYE